MGLFQTNRHFQWAHQTLSALHLNIVNQRGTISFARWSVLIYTRGKWNFVFYSLHTSGELCKNLTEWNIKDVVNTLSWPVNNIKVNVIDADVGIHTNYTSQLPVDARIQLSIAGPMSVLFALMLPGIRESGLASRPICVMLTISSCLLFEARQEHRR